jgi:hypothetical protein
MYQERRRDAPPPSAMCLRCGWSGTPPHLPLLDENGDVALTLSGKQCPNCTAQLIVLREKRPSRIVEIITELRNADLSADDLAALADVVRAAPKGVSPRTLAADAPRAARVITIASREGKDWLPLLAVILTLVVAYIQHADAERAHHDAVVAHQDAIVAHRDAVVAHQDADATLRSSSLTQADIDRIVHQVEERMAAIGARPSRP